LIFIGKNCILGSFNRKYIFHSSLQTLITANIYIKEYPIDPNYLYINQLIMKTLSLLSLLIVLTTSFVFPQVAINTDGSSTNNLAVLDVKSTN